MKTFNETAANKLATLRRQHEQLSHQITALEVYLKVSRRAQPQSTPKTKHPKNKAKTAKP